MFLWFISGDTRLPTDWQENIRDVDNAVYLSVVSLWEALVKYRLGKLPLPHPPESYLPTQRARHQIASLSLDEASVCHLSTLPTAHRDSFDRMLACQALEHGLSIVTVDSVFGAYPAPILDRT
jgi:PIN domain nuclease of toxin-antitoxin system